LEVFGRLSLKNVLRKLKKEASTKARDLGHTLGRFYPRDKSSYSSECDHCGEEAIIIPAVEIGTHVLFGTVLKSQCSNHRG
jgi:hypothetical protein